MYNGNVVEVSMFIGRNREKHVPMHGVQELTHREMADNLHCRETPQWQCDGTSRKTSITTLDWGEHWGGSMEKGRGDPSAY